MVAKRLEFPLSLTFDDVASSLATAFLSRLFSEKIHLFYWFKF